MPYHINFGWYAISLLINEVLILTYDKVTSKKSFLA